MNIIWVYTESGVTVSFSDNGISVHSLQLTKDQFEGFMTRFLNQSFLGKSAEVHYPQNTYTDAASYEELKEKIVIALIERLDEYLLKILTSKVGEVVETKYFARGIIIQAKTVVELLMSRLCSEPGSSESIYAIFVRIKSILAIEPVAKRGLEESIKVAIRALLEAIKNGHIFKAMKLSSNKLNDYELPSSIDEKCIISFNLYPTPANELSVASATEVAQKSPVKTERKRKGDLSLEEIKAKFQNRLRRFTDNFSLGLGDKHMEILSYLFEMIHTADLLKLKSKESVENVRQGLLEVIREEREKKINGDYKCTNTVTFSKEEQYYWGVTSQISDIATQVIIEKIDSTGILRRLCERFPNPTLLLEACAYAYSTHRAREVYNSMMRLLSSTYPYMLQRGNTNGEYIVTPIAMTALVEGILFVNIQGAQHGPKLTQNIRDLEDISRVLQTLLKKVNNKSVEEYPDTVKHIQSIHYFSSYIALHLRVAQIAHNFYVAQKDGRWRESYQQEALKRPALSSVFQDDTPSYDIVRKWTEVVLLSRFHVEDACNPANLSPYPAFELGEIFSIKEAVEACTFPYITEYDEYLSSIESLYSATVQLGQHPERILPVIPRDEAKQQDIIAAREAKKRQSWSVEQVSGDIFRACLGNIKQPSFGVFFDNELPATYPCVTGSVKERSRSFSGIDFINCAWFLVDSSRIKKQSQQESKISAEQDESTLNEASPAVESEKSERMSTPVKSTTLKEIDVQTPKQVERKESLSFASPDSVVDPNKKAFQLG
jgi:hypothetical protein